jgi:cyclin-dependent kinase 6
MASNSSSSPLNSYPLYEEISVVGTGAYGTVYKGYDLKTSRIVAMKRIRIQMTEEGLPISTVREIAYLRHLEKHDHENIVKLLDVCHGPRLQSEQSIILIFEYVDYDLNAYMRAFGEKLKADKISDLMRQMLVGVDFLHVNRIIHRDLKPQNILVTKEGLVKIADFGLARIYNYTMKHTSVVVTLWYRSPEVLLHSIYSTSVDIWSLGCIFAELYMKQPLFPGSSDIDQLFKIFEILGLPKECDWPVNSVIPLESFMNNCKNTERLALDKLIPSMSRSAIDLLKQLLDFNMNNRISTKQALLHDYFNEFIDPTVDKSLEALDCVNEKSKSENILMSTTKQEQTLSSLPDITNIFKPNILKRKRNNQEAKN